MNETQRCISDAVANGAKMLPDSIRMIAECFCGCGEPEKAWQWVLDYLRCCKAKTFFASHSATEWIAIYLMNHLQLTEHGSGIRGAWLTEKGESALTFLEEHSADWCDNWYWVDSKGISWGTDIDPLPRP